MICTLVILNMRCFLQGTIDDGFVASDFFMDIIGGTGSQWVLGVRAGLAAAVAAQVMPACRVFECWAHS